MLTEKTQWERKIGMQEREERIVRCPWINEGRGGSVLRLETADHSHSRGAGFTGIRWGRWEDQVSACESWVVMRVEVWRVERKLWNNHLMTAREWRDQIARQYWVPFKVGGHEVNKPSQLSGHFSSRSDVQILVYGRWRLARNRVLG